MLSGKALQEVTAEERQAAKIMNFLMIYAGSAKNLQSRVQLDYGIVISSDEAEEYARLLKEIIQQVGSKLLHPVPVKEGVKILTSLDG